MKHIIEFSVFRMVITLFLFEDNVGFGFSISDDGIGFRSKIVSMDFYFNDVVKKD